MRDQFNTGKRQPSRQEMQRLLAGAQASSFNVPGSTMAGFRSDTFFSDLPDPKTIVVRAYAIGLLHDKTIPCGIDPLAPPSGAFTAAIPPAIDPVRIFTQARPTEGNGGFFDPTIYTCNLKAIHPNDKALGYDGVEVDRASKPHLAVSLVESRDLRKTMQCNWQRGAFYLPTYYEDPAVISLGFTQRRPEEFTAAYDYITGSLIPVDCKIIRVAAAISNGIQMPTLPALGRVDVQVMVQRLNGLYVHSNTFILNVTYSFVDFTINRGDQLFIMLVDGVWVVLRAATKVGGPYDIAHDIEFTLGGGLSTSDPWATASVDSFSNGATPGTNVRVYNPSRGCGTGAYRFWGAAGCKGSAVYLREVDKYKIIQLDCDDEVSGPPEESASSVSELSSSSSTSSLSSSSSTCSDEEASSSTS